MLLLGGVSADGVSADVCVPEEGVEPGAVCELVLRVTGNATLARLGDTLLTHSFRLLLVVAVALVLSRLIKRSIRRFTRGLASAHADLTNAAERTAGTLLRTSAITSARASQRAETIGALLGSVATFTIWTVAALMIFGELGLELGPLLAGAGIAGIALGFGAQNLVRDFLSGIFMLIEDQYGVGDIIDAGPATGVVEGVSLRTTRLRDIEGSVWHIPNGSISRVANKGQQWARALLDVEVSYATDVEHASQVIKRVADELWQDPDWSREVTEEPEIWGVESLGSSGVAIRLVVRTRPLSQWKVARELRGRIKAAFDAEGIEIPFPQQVVWHRGQPPVATGGGSANGD